MRIQWLLQIAFCWSNEQKCKYRVQCSRCILSPSSAPGRTSARCARGMRACSGERLSPSLGSLASRTGPPPAWSSARGRTSRPGGRTPVPSSRCSSPGSKGRSLGDLGGRCSRSGRDGNGVRKRELPSSLPWSCPAKGPSPRQWTREIPSLSSLSGVKIRTRANDIHDTLN